MRLTGPTGVGDSRSDFYDEFYFITPCFNCDDLGTYARVFNYFFFCCKNKKEVKITSKGDEQKNSDIEYNTWFGGY